MGRWSKQHWSDLSAKRQAIVAGAAVVQLGLLAAALADLQRQPSARVRGSKAMWAAVSFVNFVGPLAYFAFGRKR